MDIGEMIIQGHALTELLNMDSDSIDCVVTSPPYWSLRKYDIPDVIFDGAEGCEHQWKQERVYRDSPTREKASECFSDDSTPKSQPWKVNDRCSKCGAWRGQLGLEPTFDLYLKHLLEIFDEVKRVLKKEGTCWVNLGDSYGGSLQGYGASAPSKTGFQKPCTMDIRYNPVKPATADIYKKSLILIPYRFAIAMIDRGWICRNVIIWYKRNCMPSSAKDRFTVDFEPVFFFTKSRKYYFEQQYDLANYPNQGHWGKDEKYYGDNTKNARKLQDYVNSDKRNKRCVWDCPTQPYPESHFATFPEDLVEPMIKAGCPVNGMILDPFCGSGTVLKVAEKLQHQAIGIDLGYEELATKKTQWNQIELMP